MTMTGRVDGLRSSVGTQLPTLAVVTDTADVSDAAHRAARLLAEINDVQVRDITLQSSPAQLVQLALDQHPRLVIAAMTSGEIAARVAWSTHVPLLAVPEEMQTLPHRIVIAMDLDPSQLGDFVPVLSLFGRASSMTCLHVQKPENFPGSDSPVFARAYDRAVSEAFVVVSEAATNANGLPAKLATVKGDPAEEIIRFAKTSRAELVVLGLRRHFGAHTLEGGRVARDVLRRAPCCVLIVPERQGSSDPER